MAYKSEIVSDSYDEVEADFSFSLPETFVLSDKVNFGFHPVKGRNIILSKNRHYAKRSRPKVSIGECILYGERPLTGMAEMEVKVTNYDDSEQNSSLRIGVMRLKFNSQLSCENLPRYSEDGEEHCVWLDQSIYNNFSTHKSGEYILNEPIVKGRVNKDGGIVNQYSEVSLLQLELGDRVGFHLTKRGELLFLINGKSQGVAVTGVYREGFRVYPVVEIIGKCCGIKITRAGKCMLFTCQSLHAVYLLTGQIATA